MDIAGSNGTAFQDSSRLREAPARSPADTGPRDPAGSNGGPAPGAAGGLARATTIEAPEQAGRARTADGNPPRYPSDPDRVTLSRASLQAAQQAQGGGAVFDNDTGEVVAERPEPPAQSRTALNAYTSVQNLSGQ